MAPPIRPWGRRRVSGSSWPATRGACPSPAVTSQPWPTLSSSRQPQLRLLAPQRCSSPVRLHPPPLPSATAHAAAWRATRQPGGRPGGNPYPCPFPSRTTTSSHPPPVPPPTTTIPLPRAPGCGVRRLASVPLPSHPHYTTLPGERRWRRGWEGGRGGGGDGRWGWEGDGWGGGDGDGSGSTRARARSLARRPSAAPHLNPPPVLPPWQGVWLRCSSQVPAVQPSRGVSGAGPRGVAAGGGGRDVGVAEGPGRRGGGGPGVALGAAGALCCVALLYTGVWLVESGRLSGAALAPAGGGARQQRGRARQGSAAGRGSRAKAVAGDDDSDRGGDGAVATPEQRARADRWVAGLWVGLIVYTLAAAGAGRAGAERAAAAEVAAVAAARAGRSRRADRTPLALAPPGLAPRLAAPPPAAKEQEPQGRPGNSRFDRLATPLAPPGGVSAKSLDALRERLRASRIDASSGGRAEAAAAAAWGAGRG